MYVELSLPHSWKDTDHATHTEPVRRELWPVLGSEGFQWWAAWVTFSVKMSNFISTITYIICITRLQPLLSTVNTVLSERDPFSLIPESWTQWQTSESPTTHLSHINLRPSPSSSFTSGWISVLHCTLYIRVEHYITYNLSQSGTSLSWGTHK